MKKHLRIAYDQAQLPVLPMWYTITRLHLEEAHCMDHEGLDACRQVACVGHLGQMVGQGPQEQLVLLTEIIQDNWRTDYGTLARP
jgi:hypothetical protein